MQKVIAIVGPTASGKTALSIALAKHFCGEIVSADSMQIYREMQIGTAKPTEEEREGVPHHLMGHVSVETAYNVASYVEDAKKIMADLKARNVIPILCGGTGMYLRHLLEATDFFDIPIDTEIRNRYQEIGKTNGQDTLYQQLMKVDPVLATNLHPNDIKRVIRGLEVYEITGKCLSEFQKESKRQSPYDVLYIGINYKNRDILYQRINKRVDIMIEQGLEREVIDLLGHYNLSETARAAIGYKELIDTLGAGGSLEEAIELIKQKSRNYAKRQLSWFRRNTDIHWQYPDQDGFENVCLNAIAISEKFLKGDN